jgi:hypothetical protein
MPHMNLDETQYRQLMGWIGVFEHFKATGTIAVNGDMKGVLREIYQDVMHNNLNTDCNTCLSHALNFLHGKILQFEESHPEVKTLKNA